ncbi:MAG: peptidoglycan DD-metalloendopeptidase family protein [Alphaproteobacteria bacterium]|nr:peptidoglycan DD-metalloendopeptidase family protein [Alphaproteobacteria bacterium]MBU1521855.1 peptidoglycan DD-metalloendopeptidase family protein [Alphaproteobacteria bacterium]MBU2030432.1 peptidoglycan DD-metalloendopeptidase family protein [Alphaproteobacteria bacterium]MBU2164456.1 peptidoglycan DD-metalloendopeptidase family protein [Alphaproteobacteria bacterium]MBU2232528.1 peptidoglycan DD-metalloendopeptidase family protein [Alphaproteobacteria bacterium]
MISGWIRAVVIAGASLSAAACMTYPSEPQYSTRPTVGGQGAYPPPAQQGPYGQPTSPQAQPYPQPQATAPVGQVDGGYLPPPVAVTPTQPTYAPPASSYPASPTPSGVVTPGAAYEIQPGDTISGVGRRFQTPVQTLIDLNGLGPRGAITTGQRIILPDAAVDTGRDPYATGPSPAGVLVPNSGMAPPPPPPPPSGNAALPSQTRPTAPAAGAARPPVSAAPSATPVAGGPIALLWPVRGDILRRFGPVGMGERNNGINIGASAGASVVASAGGRVAYVGDDLVGQGLTVLVVHNGGWRTVYGHLGSATVKDGDDVRAGQQIGTVGLTAGDGRPSIHFETRQMRGDDPVAVDPLTVLPR